MRDWTDIGFSSIYYLLDRLAATGLVTSRRETAPGRGPARKVYAATPVGVAALHDRALDALAGTGRAPANLQLGLSVLPMLEREAVATALRRHRNELERRIALLDERRGGPLHVEAMFDLAKTLVHAELDWLDRFTRTFDPQEAS
jgi:DNA-binding PadR family transcriptional regulator